ncbi:MAG: NYN domain-containing protein [Myxococcota bacterium]
MDRKAAREVEMMIDTEFAGLERSNAEATSRPSERDPTETKAGAGEEPRIILVDGFNVLHAVLLGNERKGGWWKRDARERLLRRVRSWPGLNDSLWVAFDGSLPTWSVWAEPVAIPQDCAPTSPAVRPLVHSVFVESADDWIVRRARRSEAPGRLLVVTGDRQVAGRARSAGAEISSPWSFISRCPSDTSDSSDSSDASGASGASEKSGSEQTSEADPG